MTYSSRLFLYVGMLILLLSGMMTLSFTTARDVVLESGGESLRYLAARNQDSIRAQREELLHYTDVIGSDAGLLDLVEDARAAGNTDLSDYYRKRFAALPLDSRVILSPQGEVLLGSEYPQLVKQARRHQLTGMRDHFYFVTPDALVLVAMGPIERQGKALGNSFVARAMNREWLSNQVGGGPDYLMFFERGSEVLWGSKPGFQGLRVDLSDYVLQGRDQLYRLREIGLFGAENGMPRLWIAVSQTRVLALLERYREWVILFAVLGGASVVLVGWLMLRNFNQAFARLMLTTEQMMDGKLPVINRATPRTEMDKLVNRFADVLDSLRQEQGELRRAHRKLHETAITDSLTGMYNRRYLQQVTPGLFAQVARDERYLTAILLDLDHFKIINDKHGHLGGDAVLVHFARLLKHNSRANDHLFRIGGEEFLVLNVTRDPSSSVVLAEKIRQLVAQSPANYHGTEIAVSVSAGISCYSEGTGEASLSSLMRAADKALYTAKSRGRNRVVLHSTCRDATAAARRSRGLKLVHDSTTVKPDR
jgi:diguanylate cyclase (GGDEF)-like protein